MTWCHSDSQCRQIRDSFSFSFQKAPSCTTQAIVSIHILSAASNRPTERGWPGHGQPEGSVIPRLRQQSCVRGRIDLKPRSGGQRTYARYTCTLIEDQG